MPAQQRLRARPEGPLSVVRAPTRHEGSGLLRGRRGKAGSQPIATRGLWSDGSLSQSAAENGGRRIVRWGRYKEW